MALTCLTNWFQIWNSIRLVVFWGVHMWGFIAEIEAWWDFVLYCVSAIIGVKITWDIWRGTRLVNKVLVDLPFGWFSAAGKILNVLWMFPSLVINFSGRRIAAARYLVELEILQPAASKPSQSDYNDNKEFEGAIDEWRKAELERLKDVQGVLKQQLSERPDFWGVLWRKTRRLIFGDPRGQEKLPTVVKIDDFPSLDDSRLAIKRYFNTLRDMGIKDKNFLSIVEIEAGYLAPLYLITGLINRFSDEDGWKLILENYRRLVNDDLEYAEELRELRAFLFNCWLLWGPSVSPCTCKAWRAVASPLNLTIQYGYGDENNSIDVTIVKGRDASFLRVFKDRLNATPDQIDFGKFTPTAILAAPYTVKGRFKWGPHLSNEEVSPAQRLIQGGTGDARKPGAGRIVLECTHGDLTLNDETVSARYYSAYLWIMFVVVNSRGECFFRDRSWKNLLPYFEHGNIADATTFLTLKECLIAKVVSSLKELLNRQPQKGQDVSLCYSCAIDDTQCNECDDGDARSGMNQALFQSSPGRPAEGGTRKEERIIDILKAAVKADDFLRDAVTRGRLRLEPAGRAADAYASCRLPGVVEGFYRDLKQEEPAGRASRPETVPLQRSATVVQPQ